MNKSLIALGVAAAALAAGSYVWLNHEKQDDPVNNVDRRSGVWYPPYASRDDYGSKKANYGADVNRAFHENPQLATSVCYELRHSLVDEATLPPKEKFFRALLTANCMSVPHEQQIAAAKAAKAQQLAGSLDDLMAQALAFAASIPPEQRHDTENRLINDSAELTDVNEAFTAGARAIALRPQDSRGTYVLLHAAAFAWNSTSFKPDAVRTFLESFYRARIAAGGDEAWKWQYGYRGLLMLAGRYDEAKAMTPKLPMSGDLNVQFETVDRAILARMDGNRAAFDEVMKTCGIDCWYDASGEIEALLGIQKEKMPPSLKQILIDAIRANPDNWPYRMTLIRDVQEIDRPLATAEYRRVLRDDRARAPQEAVIDTVYGLGKIAAFDGDQPKYIALTDCWLSMNGVRVAPVEADVWQRLGALPNTAPESPKQDDAPCFASTLRDPQRAGDCATTAFLRRLTASIETKNFAAAKQSVEQLAAYVLANRMTADAPRVALVQLASAERDNGMSGEAQQIAAYLATHPHGAYVEQAVAGITAAPAAEPWHAPTTAPVSKSACPPD